MPFPVCPSTKKPILCSGMVAASPAAPTGAQHCPSQTLRSASGSSTPGNRLPQPTTQPAVVHAPGQPTRWHTTVSKQPGYLLPLIPPWRYRWGTTAKSYRRSATAEELPPCTLPPANLPAGHTTARWVLPRDGSRAKRAGDSDVGANDKGAGDDPGDWVDAH